MLLYPRSWTRYWTGLEWYRINKPDWEVTKVLIPRRFYREIKKKNGEAIVFGVEIGIVIGRRLPQHIPAFRSQETDMWL